MTFMRDPAWLNAALLILAFLMICLWAKAYRMIWNRSTGESSSSSSSAA